MYTVATEVASVGVSAAFNMSCFLGWSGSLSLLSCPVLPHSNIHHCCIMPAAGRGFRKMR